MMYIQAITYHTFAAAETAPLMDTLRAFFLSSVNQALLSYLHEKQELEYFRPIFISASFLALFQAGVLELRTSLKSDYIEGC